MIPMLTISIPGGDVAALLMKPDLAQLERRLGVRLLNRMTGNPGFWAAVISKAW